MLALLFAALSAPPNVLLVMTDDQGWGDLSIHGNEYLETPHLDSIAEDGARLKWFYVSPVCAPTRASLLTGRMHLRTNVHGVTRGMENMRADEVTIAELFKDAGYATAAFGKWHNGAAYPMDPVGQGFDLFVGFCAGHWDNYFDTTVREDRRGRGSRPLKTDGYLPDLLTDRAIGFMRNQHAAGRPFLCYVPYQTPHWPAQVPDKHFDRFADVAGLDVKAKAAYAMVANIDENVGRMLAWLDEAGVAEETIVVFLTDNGANSDRYDGGMRQQKGSVHEGGSRVPCFVRWPGKVKPGTLIEPVTWHCDLLPTLSAMCGVSTAGTKPLDGRDLSPLLLGTGDVDLGERHLVTVRKTGAAAAVRGPRYRLVKPRMDRPWQLYDITEDPHETTDLAKKHPEVVGAMAASYTKLMAEADAKSLEPLPIPVGHPERPSVELQGHEAFLHGASGVEADNGVFRQPGGDGIRYHGDNGWANDWVEQWTGPAAYPFWRIDVAEAGDFEVTVRYALHPADVGVRLKAVAGGASAEATVDAGLISANHDSPDRFPRSETYTRDWLTRRLGVVSLPAGESRLELRAADIPGREAPQVKGVILRRLP